MSSPTFAVHNPATGEVIGEAQRHDEHDVARAIDRAAAAFSTWRHTPAVTRAAALRRIAALLEANAESLAATMTAESGKPLRESRAEVRYTSNYFSWFAGEAERMYGEQIPAPKPEQQLHVISQPVGVCALITPWNFPLAMAGRKLAAALAAGCTAVCKPAEATPLSMLDLAAICAEAGVPPGVVEVVTGPPAPIGEALLAPGNAVAKLSFTGSTAVGIALATAAAASLKRVSLELGGNAPFLVFADADLDEAVAGFMAAKFRNAGQTCVAANRLLLSADIYDAFMQRLVAKVAALRVGNGAEVGTDIGPLISPQAVARVASYVRETLAAGATLRLGQLPADAAARFFAPMIVEGVAPGTPLWQREIFGPVVAVTRFRSDAEALAMANDTDSGLCAYAYTTSAARQRALASSLDVGMLGVNEPAISNPHAPFGGIKQSGYGREGSRHGLADYTYLKYIATTIKATP